MWQVANAYFGADVSVVPGARARTPLNSIPALQNHHSMPPETVSGQTQEAVPDGLEVRRRK